VKKFLAITFAIFLIGGVALFASAPKGLGISSLLYFMNEDQKELFKLAEKFLEAIKYKDFKAAADFHNAADMKKADIPKLIERLFKVKHELLNIRDLAVTKVDVDSTGKRARTFFNANVEMLNSLQKGGDGKQRKHNDTEGILYWQKEDGKWVMKLESSLKK
jgi:hypothetical protein